MKSYESSYTGPPDLDAFCRLGDLGLTFTSQRVESNWGGLAADQFVGVCRGATSPQGDLRALQACTCKFRSWRLEQATPLGSRDCSR